MDGHSTLGFILPHHDIYVYMDKDPMHNRGLD